MKNLIKIIQCFFATLCIVNFSTPLDTFSQGTYFHDADFVYLRNGNPDNFDSIGANDQRTIYWDLSSIDTNANRLDICIGYNELNTGFETDYLWGNWLRNEDNVNFNYENSDLRFIYSELPSISDSITGVSFINLKENARNYLVVLRSNGNMEIRKNQSSFIQITDPDIVSGVYGKNPVVGKFTTDTLQDLAIISPTGIRVFKGKGGTDPTLEEVFVLQYFNFKKINLTQISKHYGPYAIINNETSDRDDIAAQYGNNIYIFNNNNDSTTNSSPNTTISFSEFLSDFKVADVNNDGYNDIIAVTQYEIELITYGRIMIFLNNNGTISTTPIYNNGGIRHPNSIEAADFNKDGWNDLIIDRGSDTLSLFLNQKNSSLFSNVSSESFRYENAPGPFLINPMYARKIVAADLYNKGGIGVIFAGWNSGAPLEKFESIIRINATTTDANPAPAYLFKATFADDDTIRPMLILYNRGDRDFQKYKIYKKSPTTNYYWLLIDSTTEGEYIDYNEIFTTGSPGDPRPPDNCFYYVKAQDNSYKVSINSDTIAYPTIVCPTCPWGPDNISGNENAGVELPKSYSITNFPNPFNPSTKIYYTIPNEGNVKITVYNSLGQTVIELVNEFKQPGAYITEFNGYNMSSGIYFYKFESGNFIQTKRMLLLK